MGATPRPGDPEPAVIEACRRGDREALELVLRQQTPALERLLARLVGPSADLEDLLQNTLIAAVQSFPRFRGEASVRSWMARIAVNVVRQHWRVPEKRRKVKLGLVPADEGADNAPAIDEVADKRERLVRLFHHLESIGPKKRLAFVLHVFEGLSLEEVAALTGASKSATKSRVFWARRALLAKARKDPALRDMVEEDES
jgi:RNA polymerase sigma-70 factor (ECF subfamily)